MSAAVRVDVFRTAIVDPASVAGILTAAERAAHDQLTGWAARARAATRRALLRVVVAHRGGTAPHEVVLAYCCAVCGGTHGKPFVRVPGDAAPLHVSVSASETTVLVAVADVPVGVDVQRCAATAFAGFAAVALSDRERAELSEKAAPELRARFWVRKEAVLKLSGVGLSVAPDEMHVGLDHDGPIRVPERVYGSAWVSLSPVPVPAGYRAAVAVGGRLPATVRVNDGRPLLAAAQAAAARTAMA